MRTTQKMGWALAITTLLSTVVGCGGSAAPEPATPVSMDAKGGYPAAEAAPAPRSEGYGQPQAQSAPPPAPMQPGAAPSRSSAQHYDVEKKAEGPADRPGLGTQWGETRTSRISTVPFERADFGTPFATAALYYNDEEGARAVAGNAGFRRTPSGAFKIANGLVSVGLRDEGGRFFGGFISGGRDYVVGEAGHRYSIVVKNNTNFRLEVVLSVDGLDVLDGKAAAFNKRGYLVDPRSEVEIDGFRQSLDTVAAFRFGSVRGSYAAQKHGDTRNVGVIGVAVFNERGTNPVPWTPDEVQQRRDANPFPGQFATPP
ncbi:MAG: hypothetical protein QM820_54475 [Minicystis sp.]